MKAAKVTEKDFTATVIGMARAFGWKVAHFRPARVVRRGVEKYETPVAGDGKGFPDLLFVHVTHGCVVAELKVGKNTTTEDQKLWLAFFEAAGVPAYTWRPGDWEEIEAVLRGEGKL